VLGVLHSSRREEVSLLMKVKLLDRGSTASRPAVDRQPVPRVAVARRIDSQRPTRVWSLLLPPRFRPFDPK